jgi:DNA-binding phage protein
MTIDTDEFLPFNAADYLTSIEAIAAYLEAAAEAARTEPHDTDRAYLLKAIEDSAQALRKLEQ